jgi:hypothetical protein
MSLPVYTSCGCALKQLPLPRTFPPLLYYPGPDGVVHDAPVCMHSPGVAGTRRIVVA